MKVQSNSVKTNSRGLVENVRITMIRYNLEEKTEAKYA